MVSPLSNLPPAGNRHARKSVPRPVTLLVVLAGLIASLVCAAVVRRGEQSERQQRFARLVDSRLRIFDERMIRFEDVLTSLRTLFENADSVSREDFRRVTADFLARQDGVIALRWVPVVRAEDRDNWEARQRNEGAAGFQIVEPQGNARRAAARPSYYPICYAEPADANASMLGFDLLAGPHAPYLEEAAASGVAIASPKLPMRGEPPDAWPVVGTLAVFERRQPTDTPEQRRAALKGFVQLVCHLETVLKSSMNGLRKSGFDLLLLQGDTNGGPIVPVAFLPAEMRRQPLPSAPDKPFVGPLALNEDDRIGHRSWLFSFRPCPEWLAENSSPYPVAVLLIGLLVTGITGLSLSAANVRTRVVTNEVESRTRELSELNRSYAEEIRERRRAEETLAREGNLLRTLLDTLPELIYVKDTAGRYLLVNEAHRRFHRLGENTTLVGRTVFDLVPPELAQRYHDDDQHVLGTGLPVQDREEPARLPDGGEGTLLTTKLALRDGAGKIVGLVGVSRDITAQKRAHAEQQALDHRLQETQKLESLGVLAGGIAHDFNNILTSVLGYASLTRLELVEHPTAQAHLERIEQAALRAAELCKQMLAYSGRGHFVVHQVDVSRLVEETIPLVQVSLSKRITLRHQLERGLPAVIADVTQIRQIIMNLVINAADAIGERAGLVYIATGVMRADRAYLTQTYLSPELAEGDYVYLEVRDDGCGMSAETKARIFEPFFSTKFTGRGLGLAAVLGIVRGHGGAIRVDSEPGLGTTFRLLLPAAKGVVPVPANPPPAATADLRATGTILVVDDEENVRTVAARILETLGFDSVLTANGAEALAVFREEPARFAAVLLDLTMPTMDGAETFQRLQALSPGLPVVIMSGFSEQEAVTQFTGEGFAGFVQKPFQIGVLRKRLQHVLSRRNA
jgi:two-component system, cell cycle sensor histidine kinase and response regulator CckA